MTEGSSETERLEFRLLGPLEIWRSGTRLPRGGRQQLAILAVLLCERNNAASIGRIADALWGDDPPAGYVTSVQTDVFHLRELLEPDRARGARARILVTEPGGYRLSTGAIRSTRCCLGS